LITVRVEVRVSITIYDNSPYTNTNPNPNSITIDDVAVVIDSGRSKEKVYDPHLKLAYLKSTWISQASARQRKGRAGRTRAGVCFHLFSKRRHANLPEFQDSEILRMPLEELGNHNPSPHTNTIPTSTPTPNPTPNTNPNLNPNKLVLQAKELGVAPGYGDALDGVRAFLQKALDPPHELSITNAISLLQSINCMDELEQVTSMGRAVSLLPMDPRIGRIILLGCILGCGPAVLSTSTAMGYRDPFIMPASDQQRSACNMAKTKLTKGFPSDQIALLKALEGFNGGRQAQFCDEYFLSRTTMNYLKELISQLTQTLKESGIAPGESRFTQRNDKDIPLVMSLISIGLYPDVGVRHKGTVPFFTGYG
jgi:ATP-dependent RNA helicase DHX36